MVYGYFDASALAKRFLSEIGSVVVDHILGSMPTDRLLCSAIGAAEVLSVIVRRKNERRLTAIESAQAIASLRTEVIDEGKLGIVQVTNALVMDCLPLIERHSINASDAIVLRSALDEALLRRLTGDDLVLIASDVRLLKAAKAEGLATFDPERQPQQELDALLGTAPTP